MEEDFSKYNGEGTHLRKLQLRALEILIEFDKICRKHKIDYWLTAGTMLGAVRHGGFIPWDDDIDISVRYKDLKRLSRVLQEDLPEQFVVQDYSTDKNYYLDSFLKVRDRKSFFHWEAHRSFKEQGIHLDIIAMEKIPSQKFKKFVFKFNKQPYLRRKEKSLNGRSNNILGLLLAPFSFLKFAHWYSNNSSTNYYGYNYLFVFEHYFEIRYHKDLLFPLKTIKFEGISFYVPNNPEKYLVHRYGDFMKIPPPEKRYDHNNKVEIYD